MVEDVRMSVTKYAKENRSCELCGRPAVQTHHIWGGTRRLDHKSNLIRLCADCHERCHNHPRVGRVKCMTAKFAKGEFDLTELNEAASLNVDGWIENQGTPEALRLLTAMRARNNGRNDYGSGSSGCGRGGMATSSQVVPLGD